MKLNNFGKRTLTYQCQSIKIVDFIRKVNRELKEALLVSSVELNGHDISLITSKTGFGGTRFWFSCPICNMRAGVLYRHPVSEILACRKCLSLDYKSHRYSKMLETNGL